MALRFVHTADWHLGRVYRRIGSASALTPGWRLDAVRRIYELAVRESAQFILVAGDVFDSEAPREQVVEDVLALLADAPVPLVVIPGNHDPCSRGSLWRRESFGSRSQAIAQLRLVLEPTTLEVAGAEILAAPCDQRSRPDDPTAWFPSAARPGERIRIGLAHGRLQEYSGQTYFENAIAKDRADKAGLDYLALGDFHSYTPEDHFAVGLRTRYSGTPECTAVDEPRSGYALVVSIAEPGAAPQVEAAHVGHILPRDLGECPVERTLGLAPMRERVAALGDRERTLLGLTVRGVLTPAQLEELDQWTGELGSEFLGLEVNRSGLFAEPGEEDFDHLDLAPIERRVLEALSQPESVAEPEEETVRREAVSLYYRLLREEACS
jgi:hypothetical protein